MDDLPPLNLKCPVAFREWYRILTRTWKAHLTLAEYSLVDMILDRTLGWGKEWEIISHEQFRSGITSRDGLRRYTEGTGLSINTIRASLRTMESAGCIRVQQLPDCYHSYALNFEWNPMLREPKKRKERIPGIAQPKVRGINSCTPPVQTLEEEDANFAPKEENLKEGTNVPNFRDEAVRPATVLDARVTEIRTRSRVKRVSLLEKLLAQPKLTQYELEKIWKLVNEECYSGVPLFAWKEKEYHAIRAYMVRFRKGRHKATFGAYLDWCIRYWVAVTDEVFSSWMTDFPRTPSVMFLVRFGGEFESMFARRFEMEAMLAMSTRERMIHQLTRKGVPKPIAEEQVDQKLGITKELRRLEEQRVEIDRATKALAKARTAALQPVAPKSTMRLTRTAKASFQEPVADIPDSFGSYS